MWCEKPAPMRLFDLVQEFENPLQIPFPLHSLKGKQVKLPMGAECDCQEGGRWHVLYYPSAVLCSVRMTLKFVSSKCTSCSSTERKGARAAAFIPPSTKLVPATPAQNNTLDWAIVLCLKVYFYNSRSELGDDPTCSLKLWQKTWVENRQSSQAGRRGQARSKGSLRCLFFLLLAARARQAEKDILTSCLSSFFLVSIWVAKVDIKLKSLQPHVLDLEKYKRCQAENNASF